MTRVPSVTNISERSSARFQVAAAADVFVSKCKYWAEICSRTNASICAQNRMRLYRKGKSRKSRAVPYATRKAHASGMHGTKVASYADSSGYIEIIDHPVLELLARPNQWLSGSDYTYLRFYAQEVAGNAYSFVYELEEIYPLAPQFMRIHATEDTPIARYVWSRDRSEDVVIEPEYVMHHRLFPNLETPWVGSSPMSGIVPMLDMFDAAIVSELARWVNGGSPMWVAELPTATDDKTVEKVKAQLKNEFRGPRQAGKFLVTSGVKISNPATDHRKMQYVEGMEEISRVVWSCYGIPESVMRLNDANRASSVSGNGQYMRQTVWPRLVSDADALTAYLLPLYGYAPGEAWFAYDPPVSDDDTAKSQQALSLLTCGVITVNEARVAAGYEPIAGGDSLRSSNPFGGTYGQPGQDQKQDGSEGVDDQKQKSRGRAGEKDATEQLAGDVAEWLRSFASGVKVEQGGVLIPPPDASARLDSILNRRLAEIFVCGVRSEAGKVGESFDIVPSGALNALDRHRALAVEQVLNTTMDGLREVVMNGIASGMSTAEIAAGVRTQIEQTYLWRAENIARTETANAYGAGRNAAFVELGMEKSWLLAGGPCPMCEGFAAAKAGKKIKATEPFASAGESWVGTDGKTYTASRDIMHEPLHPSCRCTTVGTITTEGAGR